MSDMLVVYYSWSNGNTKKIAEALAKAKGADIVRIDTVKPYAGSYDDVVAQGHREVDAGYEPPIKPLGVALDGYRVIAVGTPTWWYSMAPAVRTFLDRNDFTGKTVVPFMTNAGWPGRVIRNMTALAEAHGATVAHPMQVRFDAEGGDTQETDQREVDAWMETVR